MKPRTTLILAAILVVLVGVAALFQMSRKKSMASPGKSIFPGLSAEKVDSIDINGKGKTVQLRKKNNGWIVATEGGHAADTKATGDLLKALDGFTTGNLISTSKEKKSTFEVDSTGFNVKIGQGGKTVADFIVGKPGPDYMSTYIRPVQRDEIYLIPTYLRSLVDRGETWRNTTLLDVQPEDVSSFTATNAKGTTAAEKDASGAWKITQPFSADAKPDMMAIVLRSVTQLRATGFADSTMTDAAAGLSPDTTHIEIKTTDGSTHHIIVGAMNDKRQSYTKIDSDPTIYLTPRGRFNTIFRDPTTLRADMTTTTTSPVPASALPPAPAGKK